MVGKKAYDLLYSDSSLQGNKNFKSEVKRIIGTPEKFYFERAGIEMSGEEISAEILKNLVQDILRKYPDFDTSSAVITIPAAFSILQCEATKRAGNLAGFRNVALLQEPIAASIAYGFANSQNENWLVYDLGGGTFDVALVSSCDGILTVIGHNGDNFLGGKNLDWEIVDQIIVPKINEAVKLSDFRRDNPVHQSRFTRLKYLAEQAKIELSSYEMTRIDVSGIGEDEDKNEISLLIEITRADFEQIMRPLLNRTIDLCKQTLQEAGLTFLSVSRIILVGGPSQIPCIARALKQSFGVDVSSSVDPLTVVAQGACIYGMSQHVPVNTSLDITTAPADTYLLSLNFEPLTAETEQMITGLVSGLDKDRVYTIKIQSDVEGKLSESIVLKEGKFFARIPLESNKTNYFGICLFDESGASLKVLPKSFAITQGLSIAGAPLPHSIGVAVSRHVIKDLIDYKDVFEKLIEKGTILPARRTEKYKTSRSLTRGQVKNPLWIRVGEGESDIPDRNVFVCELGIRGDDLPMDLPEGTDLNLTIEINEMRELSVSAYIPLVNLSFNARSTFLDEVIKIEDLEEDLNKQMERLRNISTIYSNEDIENISDLFVSTSNGLQNARTDEDEKRKVVKHIRDLKRLLDEAEHSSELPRLIINFTKNLQLANVIIAECHDPAKREKYAALLFELKSEGDHAISLKDKALLVSLNHRLKEIQIILRSFNYSIYIESFRFIVANGNFIDKKEANSLIKQGNEAIREEDWDLFLSIYPKLKNLSILKLPVDQKSSTETSISGIRK